MGESPTPPEERGLDCCFGATRRQSFILVSILGGILFITFFGVTMTDDDVLRFTFAITGFILAFLSYCVGVVLFKYRCPQRRTLVDFDEIESVILEDRTTPSLGLFVPGRMNSNESHLPNIIENLLRRSEYFHYKTHTQLDTYIAKLKKKCAHLTMESEDDDSEEQLMTFGGSFKESCVFCMRTAGIKLPFCRVCARTERGIQLTSTFAHRTCTEKHMNRDRKIKCPNCEMVMVMNYQGAVHEDYAMRNMRETFAHCFPSSGRTYAFNFLVVKHTLLAILSLVLMIVFVVLAPHASSETPSNSSAEMPGISWPLRLSQIIITLSFVLFLLSWFISSSSSLMYVILYGSIRNAKRQLIAEIVLYICIAAVSLISAVAWRSLLAADTLFGVWAVCVALLILAIVVIAVVDKTKTYGSLTMIGITVRVDIDEP